MSSTGGGAAPPPVLDMSRFVRLAELYYWATGQQIMSADEWAACARTGKLSDALDVWVEFGADNARVVNVSAGHSHVVCSARDGMVWSWGSNAFGQVGAGNENSVRVLHTPQAVPAHLFLEHFCSEAAADAAPTAPAAAALVAAERRRAGVVDAPLAHGVTLSGVPAMYDPVVAVYAGAFHTIAATANGALLAWGRNLEGALGLHDRQQHGRPEVVQLTIPVHAAAGSAAITPAATVPAAQDEGSGSGVLTASVMRLARPWRRLLDIACGKDFTLVVEAHVPPRRRPHAPTAFRRRSRSLQGGASSMSEGDEVTAAASLRGLRTPARRRSAPAPRSAGATPKQPLPTVHDDNSSSNRSPRALH
ncbi:hypothetical protein EON68_03940, partial [archaeon]